MYTHLYIHYSIVCYGTCLRACCAGPPPYDCILGWQGRVNKYMRTVVRICGLIHCFRVLLHQANPLEQLIIVR